MESKENNVLPLGSIVILKGDAQMAMIVSRGIGVDNGGSVYSYDYAACRYPEGMIDDKLMFFDEKDIGKVVFKGYWDERSAVIEEAFRKWKQEGMKYGGENSN